MGKDGTVTLDTKEALAYIRDYYELKTNYAISKCLSQGKNKVQAIQIAHFEKGHKMSRKTAKTFFDTFGIVITDFRGA